jgi:hypothetical protein
MHRTSWATASLAALGVCLLSGCGSQGTGEAATAAQDFARSVAQSHEPTACRYLAPATRAELEQSEGKPCPAALSATDLPRAGTLISTRRYGTMSQAVFSHDTVFLSQFPGGWKVVAAGCQPRGERPYDCSLQGG